MYRLTVDVNVFGPGTPKTTPQATKQAIPEMSSSIYSSKTLLKLSPRFRYENMHFDLHPMRWTQKFPSSFVQKKLTPVFSVWKNFWIEGIEVL